ncbi:siderophore-interacting protein [Pseudoclavibacter sp. 13-3]|uniref:siderophore-interacting protein n=1 Tax=Pseudoclavibacter sp. 13-3 TaxID=2901228 RepID=UPI001E4B7AE9|nr:siderophore-interacting protein [Pseudoclavibacter sp. 13-3]MCD7101750.1 siderophore-interacting protein [Pseudoclavibacter sp. 13-3]
MLDRQSTRHDLRVRRATVSAVSQISPSMRRITLSSTAFDDFLAPGPADHVKLFLPDEHGVINAPAVNAEGRLQRPDAPLISRDYTPRAWRAAEGDHEAQIDIDFVLHEGGPATNWAREAAIGDDLVVAGPRGSRTAPLDVDHAVLIADATALPALARWLEALPGRTVVDVIVWGADEADAEYLDALLRARIASLNWLPSDAPASALEAAVTGIDFKTGTFVWAAGEASALIPVRRRLRGCQKLDRRDLDVQGYWKRGVVALDHHAPLDPSDPE